MKKLIIFVTTTGLLFMGCKSLNLAGSASKQDRQIAQARIDDHDPEFYEQMYREIGIQYYVVSHILPFIKSQKCRETLREIEEINRKTIVARLELPVLASHDLKEWFDKRLNNYSTLLDEYKNVCRKRHTDCEELTDPSSDAFGELAKENKGFPLNFCLTR